MRILQLYDPNRQPPNWTEIVRPGEFVAFSKHLDSGAACDGEGKPFASPSDATCLIFDSLEEATGYCEERVRETPNVRFDIFDSAGRTRPALLVVVHPSRAHTLTGNPRAIRIRTMSAVALMAGAVPLMWFDYQRRGLLILPTFVGINMILLALRLLHMNMSIKEVEREREERRRGVRS